MTPVCGATPPEGGFGLRTVALLGHLPGLVAGREWFIEVGHPSDGRPVSDVFATLRA